MAPCGRAARMVGEEPDSPPQRYAMRMPTMRPGVIMPARTQSDPGQGSRRPPRMTGPQAAVIGARLALEEAAPPAFLHP